jgi:hypothetical protein
MVSLHLKMLIFIIFFNDLNSEHILPHIDMVGVTGSIPVVSTIFFHWFFQELSCRAREQSEQPEVKLVTLMSQWAASMATIRRRKDSWQVQVRRRGSGY